MGVAFGTRHTLYLLRRMSLLSLTLRLIFLSFKTVLFKRKSIVIREDARKPPHLRNTIKGYLKLAAIPKRRRKRKTSWALLFEIAGRIKKTTA